MDPSRTELHIPVGAIGPALARAAVPTVVPPLSPAAMADVQLLVSELVSDAMARSGAGAAEDIRLVVAALDDRVRFELSGATRVPRPVAGGWGRLLLDRLASEWGFDDDGANSRIWFEVPTA